MEVILVNEGSAGTVHVIDALTKLSHVTFKGAPAKDNTLCVLRQEYFIFASAQKPVLNVFEASRKRNQNKNIVIPGKANSLCTSNDGNYIASGIEETVMIWDAVTGDLVAGLRRHYQDVVCLSFTSDCAHIVSCGLDGLISLWNLPKILKSHSSTGGNVEPEWCISAHALPITSMWLSQTCSTHCRIFSGSLDKTVKVHDPSLKTTILTMVFNHPVTSLACDASESMLFVGFENGTIGIVNLIKLANDLPDSNTTAPTVNINESNSAFCSITKAHLKRITSINVGLDSSYFVTGSLDCQVKMWDVYSRQCIKSISYQNIVSSVRLCMMPPNMLSNESSPQYEFPRLAHAVSSTSQVENGCFLLGKSDSTAQQTARTNKVVSVSGASSTLTGDDSYNELVARNKALQDTVDSLTKKNQHLAAMAVERLMTY